MELAKVCNAHLILLIIYWETCSGVVFFYIAVKSAVEATA